MVTVKKKIVVSVILSAMLGQQVANASLSNFVSQSLDTAVLNQDAGYFKSQAGGLMSLGSSRIRFGGGNGIINPFNIQTPSLNIGCSGIDMVFGGFSYLNFDNIVEKLKKITTAAPAFAFKIALSTLCKDCDTIMTELEQIANAINGMNFDTCTALNNWSDKLAGSLKSNIGSTAIESGVVEDWISGFSDGVSDSVNRFTNFINGKFPSDDGGTASDKVYGQGSLLRQVLEHRKDIYFRKLIGENDYEDLLRDLIGDVVVFDSGKQSVSTGEETVDFKSIFIGGSLEAKEFASAVFGEFDTQQTKESTLRILTWSIVKDNKTGNYKKTTESDSIEVKIKHFIGEISNRIQKIVENGRANKELSEDDKYFISALSMPIVKLVDVLIASPNINGEPYFKIASISTFNDFINGLIADVQKALIIGMDKTQIEKEIQEEHLSKFREKVSKMRAEVDARAKIFKSKFADETKQLEAIENLVKGYNVRTQAGK